MTPRCWKQGCTATQGLRQIRIEEAASGPGGGTYACGSHADRPQVQLSDPPPGFVSPPTRRGLLPSGKERVR